MATERKTRRYSTYGNVAYQPAYEENAVRTPARRGAEPHRRPQVQPRERVAARPSVEVRQQDPISIFAIVGFMAVAVCVFMLLSSGIRLVTVSHETFQLQEELSDLEEKEAKLLSQYERAYDLTEIEKTLTSNGTMVKASAANTVYLDLSEPDSVIYYEQAAGGIPGVVDRLEQLFKDLLS